jgi:hypothetical protein
MQIAKNWLINGCRHVFFIFFIENRIDARTSGDKNDASWEIKEKASRSKPNGNFIASSTTKARCGAELSGS